MLNHWQKYLKSFHLTDISHGIIGHEAVSGQMIELVLAKVLQGASNGKWFIIQVDKRHWLMQCSLQVIDWNTCNEVNRSFVDTRRFRGFEVIKLHIMDKKKLQNKL